MVRRDTKLLNYKDPKGPSKWPYVVVVVILYFIVKVFNVGIDRPPSIPISAKKFPPNLSTDFSKPSPTELPALSPSNPAPAPVVSTSPKVETDIFESQLAAAVVLSNTAVEMAATAAPDKFSKDIYDLQKERLANDSSPYLTSDKFSILDNAPITLHDAAKLLANAYLIDSFRPERDGEFMKLNPNDGRLIYSKFGNEYSDIMKLNFDVNGTRYLVFDSLKLEGEVPDCHSCLASISVIKYHIENGEFAIDRLYEGVAQLGAWGNSGAIRFVKFNNGDFGFIVTDGTINQGYVSNWINAFKILPDGVAEIEDLKQSAVEPPSVDPDGQSVSAQNAQDTTMTATDTVLGGNDFSGLNQKAQSGDADAQFELGLMYDEGKEGISQDYSAAADWYSKSAEQGYPKAQHNLAVLYHDGQGVVKNYEQSYFWMLLASKAGDKNSLKLRDEVERVLSHDQVVDVQRRASEWKPGMAYEDLRQLNDHSEPSNSKTTFGSKVNRSQEMHLNE